MGTIPPQSHEKKTASSSQLAGARTPLQRSKPPTPCAPFHPRGVPRQ